jgi:3-deoxy-D-manno-octulosonate 8-phosphate phosphatase (KDO 8-P phosphatase)
MTTEEIKQKAKKIKLLLTDNDGVLTDGGVYYGENGEEFKKFNIRDGMGVERLRNLVEVETGIITGELSPSVKKRAEKLKINELHLGVKDKSSLLLEIIIRKKLASDQIAFIGDDVNDLEIMKVVGLSACPADAISFAKNQADYVCENKGGNGAFREFAELIITSKLEN